MRTQQREPRARPHRHCRRPGALVALVVVIGTVLAPAAARAVSREAPSRRAPLPALVSLVFHHSTRGIIDNALPRLQDRDGRATLALVVHELERTSIPPDVISTPDAPGGYGNVQPVSLGVADGDGLYAGRVYLDDIDGRMTDDEIRAIAGAGWELAFHGIDHTPQSRIAEQVDGAGKLARAYQAGIAEIRRLLADPTYPVRTNTLASNAWSPAVRLQAAAVFDWTEVRWTGGDTHVPVVYGSVQDPHGGFNSIDFRRGTYDGPDDLDQLVRLAATDPGAWMIIQLHDVVDEPSLSPHPDTAMTTTEFDYLLAGLDAVGARLVPFSEAAGAIGQNHAGNRLRNTHFGAHGFLAPPRRLPLDWLVNLYDGDDDTGVDFGADGRVRLSSPVAPAHVTISQRVSPWLLRGRRFVLRGEVEAPAFWDGDLTAGLAGPGGAATAAVRPGDGTFCVEIRTRDVEYGDGPVSLELRAVDFTGEVTFGALVLEPRTGRGNCR